MPNHTALTTDERASRRRQVAGAVAIFATILLLLLGLLIGRRYVPGFLGESLAGVAGVLTTPFILEAAFLVLGLLIVMTLNQWMQLREGDEFVYLDCVEGPDVPSDLPEHATFAVSPVNASPLEEPSLLARAEGALAMGDYDQAAELIAALPPAELGQPEVLEMRLQLARATGRQELVARLERTIREIEDRGVAFHDASAMKCLPS
jgi:hypothetical protein